MEQMHDPYNREWIQRSDLPRVPVWKLVLWYLGLLLEALFSLMTGVIAFSFVLFFTVGIWFTVLVGLPLMFLDLPIPAPPLVWWSILGLGLLSVLLGRHYIAGFFGAVSDSWDTAVGDLDNKLSRLRHRLPAELKLDGPFAYVVAEDEEVWPLDRIKNSDVRCRLRWLAVKGYDGHLYLTGEY